MARKLRVQYEGGIYHVTVRGTGRRSIFVEDEDRESFLVRMGNAADEYGVKVYLFCLMRNHVHLLLETPQGNLSAFMHKLQTAYTVWFNRRRRRSGHLMQGRFGSIPVEGDEYLLKLSRYIHLNPVCVKTMLLRPARERVAVLRAYAWSSYRGYAGLAKPYGFVTEGPMLGLVGGPEKRQRTEYRRFVEEGIAERDESFLDTLKESRWGIGDDGFQERMRDRHTDMAGQVRRPEDVSFRRMEPSCQARDMLRAIAKEFDVTEAALKRRQYGSVERAAAAWLLGRCAGMNQRDIATYLGMGSGSAVCRQMRRLRERMEDDSALAVRISRLARISEGDNPKEQKSIVKG